MHNEQWFVHTVWDIAEKLSRGDFYSMVRASGLLRQLLLDSQNLLSQANETDRLPIKFSILPDSWVGIQSSNGQYLQIAIIGPVTKACIAEGNFESLSIKGVLKTTMVRWGETTFTARDIIRVAAHFHGGVHRGLPRDQAERLQFILSFRKGFHNLPVFIEALWQVILVVLPALSTLTAILIDRWEMAPLAPSRALEKFNMEPSGALIEVDA